MTLQLFYPMSYFRKLSRTLTQVETKLGLKVSHEKTTVYRVGSLQNSNAKLVTQKQFKWSNQPIELLRVKINCDGSQCEQNFVEIVQKMRNVCENWYNRNATLYRKTTH